MGQARDIRDRITSVKKTKKITQAMKMVAAAKFKRAQQRVHQAKPYRNQLETILGTIISGPNADVSSPLLGSNASPHEEVLVISGDRGLCGGFNNYLFKLITQEFSGKKEQLAATSFGNKGTQYLQSRSYDLSNTYPNFADKASLRDVEHALAPVLERYAQGQVGKVWVVYNEFVSAVTAKPVVKQLLPFVAPDVEAVKDDYFFEPSKESVLDQLIRDYLNFTVYQAVLESKAGEEGARMAAMDAATDNASDMIKSLTLIYNRTRQAQITTELSEIVAGAEALKG